MNVELITDLNDPRIHPDNVIRMRCGSRQEFRKRSKSSFEGEYYIEPLEMHMDLEPEGCGWKWVNGCEECNGKPRGWSTYIECDKHNVCRKCARSRQEITGAAWGGAKGWL